MKVDISCPKCTRTHSFSSNFVRCECGRWYFRVVSSLIDPDTGETINIHTVVTRDYSSSLRYSVVEVGEI